MLGFLILLPVILSLFGVVSAATAGNLTLLGLGVIVLMFINGVFNRARRL